DAGEAGLVVLVEDVLEALVGQLHDDDQFAVDHLDALQRQEEGVADRLDQLQGAEFLLGGGGVAVEAVEVAENELDGLGQAAGGLALPDLAEAAAAQRLQEAVTGDRLGVRLL